jgi:uncharacterized membrane protein required for colicin V production
MNGLDYTLIIVITTGTIFGIFTGPLWQVYRVCSIAIASVATFLLYEILGDILNGVFRPEISNLLGGLIVFVVILVLTYALGNFFKFFLTKRKFGISGRILGGSVAFVKTVLTCCVIISMVSFIENKRAGEIINNSLIANNLNKGTRAVISKAPQDIKDKSLVKKKVILKEKNNSHEGGN